MFMKKKWIVLLVILSLLVTIGAQNVVAQDTISILKSILVHYATNEAAYDYFPDGKVNDLDWAMMSSGLITSPTPTPTVTQTPTPIPTPTFVPPGIVYTFNNGEYFMAVEKLGNYVFALTGLGAGKLYVFDVSNVNDIQPITSYLLTGSPQDLELEEDNQLLYIADISAGIHVYSVTNPLDVSLLETIPYTPSRLRLIESKNLLLAAYETWLYAIDTVDISKSAVYNLSPGNPYKPNGCVGHFDVLNDVYLSLRRVDGLCWPTTGDWRNYLMAVDNDATGPSLSFIKGQDGISGQLVFRGNTGYLVHLNEPNYYQGSYYDFSDPLNPQLLGDFNFERADEVGIWNGNLLIYVRYTGTGLLHYYDITQPEMPRELAIDVAFPGYLSTVSKPWQDRVVADGQFAYLANGREGLVVLKYEFIP